MASKEDKLLEFFQNQIRQSGYKLQTKVQKKLISSGYEVIREWPYLDKDELKGRPYMAEQESLTRHQVV